MQSGPALGPGSLVSESTRILELVFQDAFYAVYSAESTASCAKVGITEYFPADLVARAPSGEVLLRSLEMENLFNLGRDRFMAEGKALSALLHPNLLRFDGIISDHGTVFALHAAEEGRSITDLVKSSQSPPSQEEIDASLKQLLSALELLHSRDLIHANITPDTILLRPDPLLISFGATRNFLASRMRKVNLAVTPGYSAPELHFSDAKAHRPLCDIFSLAAVLYYVVTGRHPINVIARGLGHTMPPAAAVHAQKFRPEFLEAIDRGLELEPEQRPPTIKAFGEMLLGIAEKKTPESRQPAFQMAANLAESSRAAPPPPPTVLPNGPPSPAAKPVMYAPASPPGGDTDDEDDELDENDFGSSWRLGIGRILVAAVVLGLLITAGVWMLEVQFGKEPEQLANIAPGSQTVRPDNLAWQEQPPQPKEPNAEALEKGSSEATVTSRPPERQALEPAQPSTDETGKASIQKGTTNRAEREASPTPSVEADATRPADQAAATPAAPAPEPEIEKPQAGNPSTAAVTPALPREKPAPKEVTKAEQVPPPLFEASSASPAGFKFKDCDFCPQLVVVPKGEFLMGSNEHPYEKPAHKVEIADPFAIGQYEVTYEEWDRCVEAGACRYRPDHKGSPNEVAGNLSWDDVNAYLKWMSEKTGQVYRLPSEAEWEYAARAGTSTRFWWGDETGSGNANCADCGSEPKGQPSAVGSYKPNSFGLFDTVGNMAEWAQDCWNESYRGAPDDGSASTKGKCNLRVLRGGSYGSKSAYCRSSSRFRYDSDVRYEANGFRVLRELR